MIFRVLLDSIGSSEKIKSNYIKEENFQDYYYFIRNNLLASNSLTKKNKNSVSILNWIEMSVKLELFFNSRQIILVCTKKLQKFKSLNTIKACVFLELKEKIIILISRKLLLLPISYSTCFELLIEKISFFPSKYFHFSQFSHPYF